MSISSLIGDEVGTLGCASITYVRLGIHVVSTPARHESLRDIGGFVVRSFLEPSLIQPPLESVAEGSK